MTDDRSTHTLGDPLADDIRPLDEPAPTGRPETTSGSNEMRAPVGVMDPEVQAISRARTATERGAGDASSRSKSPDAIPSAAAIQGHPLHPMVVPLPIGLLASAALTDVAYLVTHDRFWARASLALTTGGVATGALAASLGLTDFVARPAIREHRIAWLHGGGNALVMGMGIASVMLRRNRPERAVAPFGLAMSLSMSSLLLVTGWLGGELVYRHRIGVVPR